MGRTLPILDLEASIKHRLRSHLRKLGYRASEHGLQPPGDTKESFRALHAAQRADLLRREFFFLASESARLIRYFASGAEVLPGAVRPRLELVAPETESARLFRLASLTWSVPVSQGYGRRMRFLVWDESNGKLIGLLALGDPVFNLGVRDDLIRWTSEQRAENLVNVMDAYVLGAVPPYNLLLGGKLVACLVRTREVRDAFATRYKDARGILSGKKKHPTLAMVTTSSSLGRSSMYNRLKLDGTPYFQPIGYTGGWGHFHIPRELFEDMRRYLESKGHSYANGHEYGNGPSWRLRTIRAALVLLGMNDDILRHGIGREVFVCRLAVNADRILRGESVRPYCRKLRTVEEVGTLARERWLVPRAARRPDYTLWARDHILGLLKAQQGVRPAREDRKVGRQA